MTSPLMFFQPTEYAWLAYLSPFALAVLAYFLYRRKTNAETHKTETDAKKTELDAITLVAREIPALLQTLQATSLSAIADQRKIAELEGTNESLRAEIREIRQNGDVSRARCEALRLTIRQIVRSTESLIIKHGDDSLVSELTRLKEQLDQHGTADEA